MRPPLNALAAGALLAGPTVLAFFTGAYFEGPRLTAAIVASSLALLAAVIAPRPLPRSRSGRLTVAAMGLFVLWSGVSIAWAPIGQDAYGDLERLLLYLAALVAATAFLRGRNALAAVEPALAGGITIVMTYSLSERLLPGLLHFERSVGAAGRLEQPLTYWNAMGALGAIGIVLCARLVGDSSRPAWMRTVAALAAAPVGTAFYLTLSRGAYGALAVGLLVLVVLSPTRAQVRGAVLVVLAAAIPGAVAARLGSVQSMHGSLSHREAQGAGLLSVLVVTAIAAAAIALLMTRAERHRRLRVAAFPLPLGRTALLAGIAVLAVVIVALAGLIHERHQVVTYRAQTTSAQRLVSLTNDRYAYWGVALDSFADHPVAGVGAAGFRGEWLARRPLPEIAKDAHSLYLETAAELGIVGLALLVALITGIVGAARGAVRVYPVRAPGMVAGLMVFGVHAGLDWDWELPALSLIAIILIAALIAAGDGAPVTAPEPALRQRRFGSRTRSRRRAFA